MDVNIQPRIYPHFLLLISSQLSVIGNLPVAILAISHLHCQNIIQYYWGTSRNLWDSSVTLVKTCFCQSFSVQCGSLEKGCAPYLPRCSRILPIAWWVMCVCFPNRVKNAELYAHVSAFLAGIAMCSLIGFSVWLPGSGKHFHSCQHSVSWPSHPSHPHVLNSALAWVGCTLKHMQTFEKT